MNRRIFLVAGMHRSGTSYLVHTLSLLGLELPISIQPGAPDNPKGHYESFNIGQYHDHLLSNLSLSWDTFLTPPEDWFSSEYAKQAVLDLSDIIALDYPGGEPIVLKDPRISLFLPLWKDVVANLGLQDFYIISVRHPFEVADSLYKRNKISKTRALLIWLNYLLNVEVSSRDSKRNFVLFPHWVNDIEKSVEKIEYDLGTRLPRKNENNILAARNEFELGLVHSKVEEIDFARSEIEKLAFSTFHSILKLTADPFDSTALSEIDRHKKTFSELSVMFAEVQFEIENKMNSKLEQQLKASSDAKELAITRSEHYKEQLTMPQADVEELDGQLQVSREALEKLTFQSDQLKQHLVEADKRSDELEQQLQESQGAVGQTMDRCVSLEVQLIETDTRSTELEQSLKRSYELLVQVTARCETLEAQLIEVDRHSNELEQKLRSISETSDQAVKWVELLDKRLKKIEEYDAGLELKVLEDTESKSKLQKKIGALKVQNSSLSKEYEQLVVAFNREKLTVFAPIYRNIYRKTGLLLRKAFPSEWVETIKKVVPSPDGVPGRLTFKPQLSDKNVPIAKIPSIATVSSSPDIFVLSIINWDFRYQRPQHIAKGLAESGRRVFYVEMDLVKSELQLIHVCENLYRARLSAKNLGHIQPYTAQPDPEQTQRWITAFYDLCDAVGSSSFKQVIVQHPFWWQLARNLSPEFQIFFDCMDDISGFSNTDQFLLDLENDLLKGCDQLIVSSKHLLKKYEEIKSPVLIHNAADLSHFTKPVDNYLTPSFLVESLTNLNKDRIKVGYVGAIAEWFDAKLVKEVAQLEPAYEFHLCGAVTANEPAQLNEIENIIMHGEIPYKDVPGFLQAMDVLIIPFKIIPIIQACDPVKFYEYSAIGKPTVTTPLPELARASDLAFFATTATEFKDQIRNAYTKSKSKNFQKRLKEYAERNTWQHRVEQFTNSLDDIPKVSIVILSYGDPELTKAALHSIYNGGASYPSLEIIIVDNGSPYEAISDIKGFAGNYPNVTVIENKENLGFARGNNVGLNAATGEYVMLLNNDTVVAPGAIYAMVRHLARNPEIGAVGPLTNNIGNEAKLFVEYEDMDQMRLVARSATTGYRGVYMPISVVAYFAVMFRREDLSDFGLLSEEYGLGMFEDDDHCAVIKSKGYLCALAEDAFVHHHLSATFSEMRSEEKEALFEANKKIYENRWGEWAPHRYRQDRPSSSYTI